MKTLLMICLMSSVYLAFSQEKKVKKQIITITHYFETGKHVFTSSQHKEELLYDERGNKVGELEYSKEGSLVKEVKYVFNEKNQIVYRKQTDFRNSFFTETAFKYSPLNKEEPSEMKEVNSKGIVVFILRHEFDDKGRIKKEIWFNKDTTKNESYSDYVYDDGNRSMEEFNYYDGKLSAKLIYKYDETGRPIEITETESSFTRMEKIEYTDSLKIRDEWMIVDGVKKKTVTETFDLKGNALEWVVYNEDNSKAPKVYDFKYRYNEHGLLVKREEFVNGKLNQEKVYEYECYD